jgi:tetratricopeptide (TPR) repeat protein
MTIVAWVALGALGGTETIEIDASEGELVHPRGSLMLGRAGTALAGPGPLLRASRRAARREARARALELRHFRRVDVALGAGAEPPPVPTRVDRAYQRSIAAWERALDRRGPGAPAAHLRLGRLLWDRGVDLDFASFQLEEALAEGVAPQDADEAWLILGELAFERADLDVAKQRYGEVIDAGGTKADYARYKRAWCAYNLGEGGAAAADALVLATTATDALAREARHDLVRFVVDQGDEAWDWLERACGGDQGCLGEASGQLQALRADLGMAP